MGKTNKKKKRKPKSNKPVENSNKRLEFALTSDIESGTLEHDRMQEMLKLLFGQGFDEDIISALATISGFVQDAKGVKVFLAQNGITKVLPFLLHTNTEIRLTAVGCLVNLLLTGGDQIADLLLNNGVVDSFMTLFRQANDVLVRSIGNSVLSQEQILKESNFLIVALDLFINLCEYSNIAVESLNLQFMLEFLHGILKSESFIASLRIKAAYCLYAVSEENANLKKLFKSHPEGLKEIIDIARKTMTTELMLLSILLAGLVNNSTDSGGKSEDVIKLIAHCLDYDVVVLARSIDKDKTQLDTLKRILEAQCISLEILSNMICHNGEDEEWEEVDNENEDVNSDEDLESVQPDGDDDVSVYRLVQQIHTLDIPKKVLSKCNVLEPNTIPSDVTENFIKVQNRSWQCLSNLLSASPNELSGNKDELQNLWRLAEQSLLLENGDLRSSRQDVLDAVSSAMRSIVEKQLQLCYLEVVSTDTVTMIHKVIFTQDLLHSTQINCISILGMVGKTVASEEDGSGILQAIGTIFTDLLSSPTVNLVVIAETLDATFDTFADGPSVDHALHNTNLMEALKTLSRTMRSKMKSERKELGDSIGIVDMARLNLNRFIKYKGTRS